MVVETEIVKIIMNRRMQIMQKWQNFAKKNWQIIAPNTNVIALITASANFN